MKKRKPKPTKVWHIRLIYPFTVDAKDIIATFYNRGHAISMLKRLNRQAWEANSEVRYCIRKG